MSRRAGGVAVALLAAVTLLTVGCRPPQTAPPTVPQQGTPPSAAPSAAADVHVSHAQIRRVSQDLDQVSASISAVERDVSQAQTAENTPDRPNTG